MKNLKQTLLMVVSLALVAALAIGGTVAYLTVDPQSENNVFSVGDINIALSEKVNVEGAGRVSETETGAEYTGVMPGDYLQKEVTVENTGSNPAYVAVEVTINNADLINKAIDEFYEAPSDKAYTDEQIQAMYDYIFDGFGMNYSKYSESGDALGMRLTITGDDMPEGVMQVDSVKTIDEYWQQYNGNWFIDDNAIIPFDGYYTTGMNKYELRYTYYMLLENKGDSVTLFKGFNVPASFNAEQLEMFNGLHVDVKASAIQADNFANAQAAFTALKAEYADNKNDGDIPEFSVTDTWDGTADTTWYNDEATEFTLTTAEQLAGMSQLIADGNTFAGKTITLDASVDMAGYDWVVTSKDFSGTFDGGNNTIYNISRTVNTYTSGRMGLFGHVESGTVKNVIIDGAEFYGYGPYGAVVAGSAYGDCVFENITLKNCNNEMYNTGSAGIVGLAYSDSNYTFKGINMDSSNSIGGYWGTYDIAAGGLIGYFWKDGDALSPVLVEDCYLAQQMNVYNDVCANYQWYAYRYSGMIIGYVNGSTTEVDGTTYPLADTVTCNNVTVEYGDWANYYYCELESNGHPSYAGENDYKFSRLVPISSVDEMSSEEYAWDNHFVLLDGDNVTCYHVTRDSNTREITGYHTHTEAEDNVCVKLTFDQLYGGGQGVYGDSTHDGVTVIYNNK